MSKISSLEENATEILMIPDRGVGVGSPSFPRTMPPAL